MEKSKGRPLDPTVGEAALEATRELLEEHGYTDLRVADVARRAGIGLGALYRRWPDKRALVLDAMRNAVSRMAVAETDDPVADVARGLDQIGEGFARHSRPLLSVVIGGQDSELANVIREAKIVPLHAANRERVRRALGDVPDLDERAEIGPALVLLDLLVRGHPPSARRIREKIMPLVVGHPLADQSER